MICRLTGAAMPTWLSWNPAYRSFMARRILRLIVLASTETSSPNNFLINGIDNNSYSENLQELWCPSATTRRDPGI